MKRIKTLFVSLGLLAGLLCLAAVPLVSGTALAATPQQSACEAVGGTFSGGSCSSSTSNGVDISHVIGDIVNILSIVVAIIAIIMIIVAGLKYVTSGGESSNVSGAKNTLLYAVVGLVVAAFAQAIVRFVLYKIK